MPFDRPKQSFAGIEDKLRKLWNLAGVIGASFRPEITPSLTIADLREPGVASFSGRHWAWVSDDLTVLPASNGVIGFKFAQDILVDGVWSQGTDAANVFYIGVYQVTPDMTQPLTLNRASGSWIDQRRLITDTPPCLDVAAVTSSGGPAYTAMRVSACRIGMLPGKASVGCPNPLEWKWGLHVPAGNSIYFDVQPITTIGTLHLGAYGRIA